MLRAYLQLTKPGIIRGNLFTATAGYMLATQGRPSLSGYLAMAGGLALIIASGCVYNNVLDRQLDRHMARTKQRALVTGAVGVPAALIYGAVLGVLGAALLWLGANLLTMIIALVGWFFYVVVYGYAKRRSVHGTLVGSISGAVPPVVGYVAATGRLDPAAWLMFIIIVAWQMPHFYAIAVMRAKDYAAARVPVLAVVHGFEATRRQIIAYIVLFLSVVPWLYVLGYTGWVYLVVACTVGAVWLGEALRRPGPKQETRWAGRLFGRSIAVMALWSLAVMLDSLLH